VSGRPVTTPAGNERPGRSASPVPRLSEYLPPDQPEMGVLCAARGSSSAIVARAESALGSLRPERFSSRCVIRPRLEQRAHCRRSVLFRLTALATISGYRKIIMTVSGKMAIALVHHLRRAEIQAWGCGRIRARRGKTRCFGPTSENRYSGRSRTPVFCRPSRDAGVVSVADHSPIPAAYRLASPRSPDY
jgi:hypothetical protein